jgi:hypothetical protein
VIAGAAPAPAATAAAPSGGPTARRAIVRLGERNHEAAATGVAGIGAPLDEQMGATAGTVAGRTATVAIGAVEKSASIPSSSMDG